MNWFERTTFWFAMGLGCGLMFFGIIHGSQFKFAAGLLLVAMMGLSWSLLLKINAYTESRKTRP